MTDPDVPGRDEPPFAADEVTTLRTFLAYQRATFAWKCEGLDEAGLATTVGASSMTLGGMLKHLAFVETQWVMHRLAGRPWAEPWASADWAADPDWDWTSAADDTPDELWALWRGAVAEADGVVDGAIETDGLDVVARRPRGDGALVSLRWLLVHLIEEYARHNGHADLIREAIDGRVGE
ncbi:DinB family protein [Williamsia sp. SKLECPSW1]